MFGTKRNKVKLKIILLLLGGFALIEFPGIFFINRIEPFLFGMPFIYSFVLLVWAGMCIILWYAYKKNWGGKS